MKRTRRHRLRQIIQRLRPEASRLFVLDYDDVLDELNSPPHLAA